MTKKLFSSFGLLLAMNMTIVMFNAHSQDKVLEQNNPLTNDDGVVINGVKWATRNVAAPRTFAAKPEDAGMFYQSNCKIGWNIVDPLVNSNGEVEWDNTYPEGYIWEKANDPSPTGWRLPTYDEIRTLLDRNKVDNEWTMLNGVKSRKFIDKTTGNFLFLPAAGFRGYRDGVLDNSGYDGNDGYYWSSSTTGNSGCFMYFYSNDQGTVASNTLRPYGFLVRSVSE